MFESVDLKALPYNKTYYVKLDVTFSSKKAVFRCAELQMYFLNMLTSLCDSHAQSNVLLHQQFSFQGHQTPTAQQEKKPLDFIFLLFMLWLNIDLSCLLESLLSPAPVLSPPRRARQK